MFFCSINGIPACANSKLLTTILRDEWNFTGYVVSDGGAIENILIHHFYYYNVEETVAGSVNAGCNLELDGGWIKPIFLYMCKDFIIMCFFLKCRQTCIKRSPLGQRKGGI